MLLLLILLLGGSCWGWLYLVTREYPLIDKGAQRTVGRGLQTVAALCLTAFVPLALIAGNRKCGTDVGPAATAAGWLTLIAVASFMFSALMLRPRAGWMAGATVIIADLVLALFAVVVTPVSGLAAMLFFVHAGCTAVATWWARQLRDSPDPLPAKAAEASRTLCASWIVVGLLLIADSHDAQLLPDSTLVGLFVATAVSLILGSGYTRYAEARADTRACTPKPDGVTELAGRLGRRLERCRRWAAGLPQWAVRYHEHF